MLKYATNWFKNSCVIPCEYNCMYSEIASEYQRLLKRYQRIVTKRRRLWELAKPRIYLEKHQYNCSGQTDKYPRVNIRDEEVKRESTRTLMLSYPKPWKLMVLRKHSSYKDFHPKRKSNMNRLMRKSLLSLYSRLSNAQPPQKPKRKPESNFERIKKYVELLSIPKRDFSKTKIQGEHRFGGKKQQKMGFVEQIRSKERQVMEQKSSKRRLTRLSAPRRTAMEEPYEWRFKPTMYNFIPSPHLLKMAQPKILKSQWLEELDHKKSLAIAGNYRVSKRLRRLATPTRVYQKKTVGTDGEVSPFEPKRRALKAKASDRTKQLAEPKSYNDVHIRKYPYKVKKAALKHKISERLKKLATPKSTSS